jgi:uncharacterized membrane protein
MCRKTSVHHAPYQHMLPALLLCDSAFFYTTAFYFKLFSFFLSIGVLAVVVLIFMVFLKVYYSISSNNSKTIESTEIVNRKKQMARVRVSGEVG